MSDDTTFVYDEALPLAVPVIGPLKLSREGVERLLVAAMQGDRETHVLIMAVLGLRPHTPPAIGIRAEIHEDGWVYTNGIDRSGAYWPELKVISVIGLRDVFRYLADRVKLSDADRVALFDHVRRWITADKRVNPEHII